MRCLFALRLPEEQFTIYQTENVLALSVARRCRPSSLSASDPASEDTASHVETGSGSSAITRSPQSQSSRAHSPNLVACHPSSACLCQNSAPSDVNPNHVVAGSPCPSRILDSRPASPTSFQRPTSPTPITSLTHDLISEDGASSLYRSILTDWNNEEEYVRVRWYMADRHERDSWDSERERVRDPNTAIAAVTASPYQYIADAWIHEDDEVQARWYLQDRCQKDAWEHACAEAELKASVPFLKPKPLAMPRSPSMFSLQSSANGPGHVEEVEKPLVSGLVPSTNGCNVESSKLARQDRVHTHAGDVEKSVPGTEFSSVVI
ncbi:hypothetical protein PENSPDRAFT_685973 [Peniophora sp. CONT]|nr:hypothetical protein PENSPDRAFT_685973 [Peniophora sp. CONT]